MSDKLPRLQLPAFVFNSSSLKRAKKLKRKLRKVFFEPNVITKSDKYHVLHVYW